MRRPTPRLVRSATRAAAAATALALAGCGDTGGGVASGSQTCGPDEGATATVDVPDFAFAPDPVAVDACDSVVWSNLHDQAHTSTGQGDQAWSTGNLPPGEESDPVRFQDPGSFTYLCALHPFMTGTVEVA